MPDYISTISNAATAVGVLIAAWQLWETHDQSVTAFEDSLAREYREITARLPTKAFFDQELTDEEKVKYFDEFFRYFDLSNEQAFLHRRKRVSEATWKFWHDGIASNLKRPGFKDAWTKVCSDDQAVFSELRALFPPDTDERERQSCAA